MACEAETKSVPTSTYDMYGGMYVGKLSGNGKIDRFQGWSRFNANTLSDTRTGSFSTGKEDNFNYKNLYNLAEENLSFPQSSESQFGGILKKSRSAVKGASSRPSRSPILHPENVKSNSQSAKPEPSKAVPRSDSSEVPRAGTTEVSSTPRIRHARSVSFAPTHGGSSAKPPSPPMASSPSSAQFAPKNLPADTPRLAPEVADVSVRRHSTDGSRLHRRGSSDMAALRGEAADFFSSDSGPKLDRETRRYSLGAEFSKDGSSGMKTKTASCTENGSTSSRGSSTAGSPTVARTGSSENLFTTGGCASSSSPTSSNASYHTRSASCNVGNLFGAISSGSYTGGGLNTGASTPRLSSSKTTIPVMPPSTLSRSGNIMYGGGSLNGNVSKGAARAQCDTPRLSSDTLSGPRGNIHAAGEGVHIKRMLSSGDPEEVKRAGNDQYKKGNFQEALTLYDRAVHLAPHRAPYRSNRAAALTGLGKLPEAVRECEEAIKLDPTYFRAHQRLASLMLRLGRIQGAKKHVKLAGQGSDAAELQRIEMVEKHVMKCFEARKAADWDSVVRESDAAVVAGADSAPQLFALKAEAFLKQQKHEDADSVLLAAQKVEDMLRRVTSLPADTTTLLVQAQIDMALGRFEGAVIAAEKAAYYDPKNADVTPMLRQARAVANARTLGNDLYKAGKILEASVAYSEGLQYNPSNAILLCNRAACRLKLGHYEKAVEDCTSALEAQPNYLKALLRRANCYVKMERWDKAVKDYETLKKEMPGDLDIAKTLYQVQVAHKKSKGEQVIVSQPRDEVEDISSSDRLREAISQPVCVASGVSVVQFNTKWSDKCRQMATYVDQLCKLHPSVNFLKVDVEENPYLAKAEQVSFVPTFKIYKNGFKVKDIVGPTHQALDTAISHFSL
ncbi:TPR repeat-containing thioredoxin TTL1 isoform X1 [Physcomitrium patens]|uniref:TPR repeat-containing thioredoxin TTL1 isoform X1 n=1 Tax=Physcomitrium patens TaxID=3218 RepID=UPI000D1661E4|nr:TPR repeat-containing thioredoxin TTL1-like isoform X1 [Physcomitrium patens]XP_024370771.1 TPR repeat-containing thioredoxin TTL1-like isoform X1 [Physcomitrium patens]|eukprot:XP_024370770.1 TPR repeat-containing thioredoxin TTL1-like isoform X1 [Physcomitrella patens]